MPLYRREPTGLTPIPTTTFAAVGMRERNDIQALLRDQIDVVAPDTLVIAEEFGDWDASQRRIDLLAIDRHANLVVIELKRDETGAHMELQALRYAAMVARITFDQAVATYSEFLDRRSRGEDARAGLLDFLKWDEPDESTFAQDVRIVLVAAGFSRELTSTVMWLNERELDIRCVQLRPHWHANELLIDVQQVLPLPEASEYQVQVREKARRERANRRPNGRDLTRYTLTIFGTPYPALAKRRAVLQAVRSLVEHGVSPDAVAPSLEHSRPFVRYPGTLGHAEFVQRMQDDLGSGNGPVPRYYLVKDSELIHFEGETFALLKRWGTNTVPTLTKLQTAFPEAGISFQAAEDSVGVDIEEDEE